MSQSMTIRDLIEALLQCHDLYLDVLIENPHGGWDDIKRVRISEDENPGKFVQLVTFRSKSNPELTTDADLEEAMNRDLSKGPTSPSVEAEEDMERHAARYDDTD
jgi:hypothetical protein